MRKKLSFAISIPGRIRPKGVASNHDAAGCRFAVVSRLDGIDVSDLTASIPLNQVADFDKLAIRVNHDYSSWDLTW